MTASARVLLLLPRQLTRPLRLALAPPSRPAVRGYFSFSILQQPHHCLARAAAAASSASSSSSCEQYPQAPIAAAPCPHDGKVDGEAAAAARGGEKAAGAQQDDSSGAGAPSPPAPKDKEALRAAGRKGRSGAPPSPRQRGRTAKPQGSGRRGRPARPGPPKERARRRRRDHPRCSSFLLSILRFAVVFVFVVDIVYSS